MSERNELNGVKVPEYFKKAKETVRKFVESNDYCKFSLSVVQVGSDSASDAYVRGKRKDCMDVGVRFNHFCVPYSAVNVPTGSDADKYLAHIVRRAQLDATGIVVQMPLPAHIVSDVQSFIDRYVDESMDVDGMRSHSPYVPCTALGIVNFLTDTHYCVSGKNVVVVGRSHIVGSPLARLLTERNATVTLCHSHTRDVAQLCESADLVILCTNKVESKEVSEYVCNSSNKCNADVIDVTLGTSNSTGKLVGSLTEDSISRMLADGRFVISGVGGVGLLTRLGLLMNTTMLSSEYAQEG